MLCELSLLALPFPYIYDPLLDHEYPDFAAAAFFRLREEKIPNDDAFPWLEEQATFVFEPYSLEDIPQHRPSLQSPMRNSFGQASVARSCDSPPLTVGA
jgi:hypothetical protein